MSTKIYNGYSFDGSFEDLFLVLKKMKSEVLKLEKNEVYLQKTKRKPLDLSMGMNFVNA